MMDPLTSVTFALNLCKFKDKFIIFDILIYANLYVIEKLIIQKIILRDMLN